MLVTIRPESQLPVHAQLKEQIRLLILCGDLAPGSRLPTVRQLAGFLRVNRNTVLRAYQELAGLGLIECRQGRGCVVKDQPKERVPRISPRVIAIIDRAIEEAGELGVRTEEFAALASARAQQRQDVHASRRIVFVECAARVAAALARVVQDRLGVAVTPLVLADLEHPSAQVEGYLRQAQVVATTFFHVERVMQLLSGSGKRVLGVGVKLPLDKLVQLSGIPRGTRALMVCASQQSADGMKQSLETAGIRGLDAVAVGADDLPTLIPALHGVPVVVASDLVADEVRPLLQPGQEMIVLDYLTLDDGALCMLEAMLRAEPPTEQAPGGRLCQHPRKAGKGRSRRQSDRESGRTA